MSKNTKTKKMFSLKDKQPKVEEQKLRTMDEITAEYQQLALEYGNWAIQVEIEKSIRLAKYQELNNEMLLTQKVMQASVAQKSAEAPEEVVSVEEAV